MLLINVAAEAFHGTLYDTQLPAGVYCNGPKPGCEAVEILADGSSATYVVVAPDSVLALHTGAMKDKVWSAL